MTAIALTQNDERLGSVAPDNSLIYPSLDVFGNAIPVRSAMQVVWFGDRQHFVCFPPNVDADSVLVALLPRGAVSLPELPEGAEALRYGDVYPDDTPIVDELPEIEIMESIVSEPVEDVPPAVIEAKPKTTSRRRKGK
jgi:hypothetical protein